MMETEAKKTAAAWADYLSRRSSLLGLSQSLFQSRAAFADIKRTHRALLQEHGYTNGKLPPNLRAAVSHQLQIIQNRAKKEAQSAAGITAPDSSEAENGGSEEGEEASPPRLEPRKTRNKTAAEEGKKEKEEGGKEGGEKSEEEEEEGAEGGGGGGGGGRGNFKKKKSGGRKRSA
ncbi:hypothetical protein VYU27_010331 [Nannochloropsis oceanica]